MKAISKAMALLVNMTLATATPSDLISSVREADVAADAAVAAIRSPQEQAAKQAEWRTGWLVAMSTIRKIDLLF